MSKDAVAGANGFLRARDGQSHQVTPLELFFDLVFVFAVTQLSHLLLEHLTGRGAFQTTLLLLAVWWAWMYTTWLTNWFDPGKLIIRLVLMGVMLSSLIMAAAIPEAFGDRGIYFAAALVIIQVGRTGVVVLLLRGHVLGANFQRILVWLMVSGAIWIAGGIADGGAREALWVIALLVDYAGPACFFYVPRLGRSRTEDWDIEGEHMAERCLLFVIIALGESILLTGATYSKVEDPTNAMLAGLIVSFVLSVTMWWIYFDRSAEAASERIAESDDPGRLGRLAYTYLHLPMVAGIIVTAVADELVIAHPDGHTSAKTATVVIGGPALYLLGHTLFKWAVFHHLPWTRPAAFVAFAALIPLATNVSPLTLGILVTVIVIAVGSWDSWAVRRQAEALS